jgi:uncharacterized protein YkwD
MFRLFFFSILLFCLFRPDAFAADESTVKRVIAHLMEADRRQHRPDLVADPLLMRVAEKRAQDMATRGYFSHVNPDGYGPNYLLAQAGYPLPEQWLRIRSTNNIESICAGYSTPELAWKSWMHSTPHRTHLLGLNRFYAEQTRFGIGYAYNPATPYKYYYVVITAPPPAVLRAEHERSASVRWMQW